MKTHPRLLALILVIALLVGCAPAPTPTAMPTATFTPPPTVTPTPEPQPTPTVKVDIKLEDLAQTKSLMIQLKADSDFSKSAGIDSDQMELKLTDTGIDGKPLIDINGNKLTIVVDHEHVRAVAIQDQNTKEWTWQKLSAIKDTSKFSGIKTGVLYYLASAEIRDKINKEYDFGFIWSDWSTNQPTQDAEPKFNSDYDFNFANSAKSDVFTQGIWPQTAPDWVKKINDPEKLNLEMIDYITALANYNKSKIGNGQKLSVIVVNEINNTLTGSQDIFYSKLGKDYYIDAYQAYRDIDPNAQLVYNDFFNGNTTDARYAITLEIVNTLKEKNLIDGVGVQMHIDASKPIDIDGLVAGLQGYGLPVHITEFDINMGNVGGDTASKDKLQAEIAQKLMKAITTSKVVQTVCVWGVKDDLSVWELPTNEAGHSPNANPLPFDNNLQPKEMKQGMIDGYIYGLTQ